MQISDTQYRGYHVEYGTFGTCIGSDKLRSRKAIFMSKIVILFIHQFNMYFKCSKEPPHRVSTTYMFRLKNKKIIFNHSHKHSYLEVRKCGSTDQ